MCVNVKTEGHDIGERRHIENKNIEGRIFVHLSLGHTCILFIAFNVGYTY